jgi:glycosyltransferase involved in cell wall biosynthesis
VNEVLSIVIVTKNDADRLAVTLESLADQETYGQWQVVIFDGCSTDGTSRVVESFAARIQQLVYVNGDDAGIYDAMNRAVPRATGDYVLFMGAGDRCHGTGVMSDLCRALAAHREVTWAIARVMHLHGGLKVPTISSTIPFRRHLLLLGRQDYNHQACVFRRESILAMGGYDPRWNFMSDLDLIARCARRDAPLELDLVIVEYEGGGVSALKALEIPLLTHAIRCQLWDLNSFARSVSAAYGWAQTIRRFGPKTVANNRKRLRKVAAT